jgi:hypothetical protein
LRETRSWPGFPEWVDIREIDCVRLREISAMLDGVWTFLRDRANQAVFTRIGAGIDVGADGI